MTTATAAAVLVGCHSRAYSEAPVSRVRATAASSTAPARKLEKTARRSAQPLERSKDAARALELREAHHAEAIAEDAEREANHADGKGYTTCRENWPARRQARLDKIAAARATRPGPVNYLIATPIVQAVDTFAANAYSSTIPTTNEDDHMTITAEAITQTVAARRAAGFIYNVEFNELKSRASRLLERDLDEWKAEHVRHARAMPSLRELSWQLLAPSVTQFPSKKASKALEAEQNPAGDAMRDLVAKYAPIREGLAELKPKIIKGRQVKQERQTPERTLENTGTCGCCGRNIKRHKSGGLVQHGYRKMHGHKWTGDCIGAGHQPIEVSPSSLHALRKALEHNAAATIPKKTTEARAAAWRAEVIAARDHAREELPKLAKRIEDWKPGTLPG